MGLIILLIGSGLLFYQGLTLTGLVNFPMISLLTGQNGILDLLTAVACKWGLLIGAMGLVLFLMVLFDKEDSFKLRSFSTTMGCILLAVAIFSIL